MSLSLVEIASIVTSITALVALIITFVKLCLDQRKTKREVDLTKQYLKTLSKLVESHIKRQESQQQIEKQRFEWNKIRDIGKALWEYVKYESERE